VNSISGTRCALLPPAVALALTATDATAQAAATSSPRTTLTRADLEAWLDVYRPLFGFAYHLIRFVVQY
jgi:hypothetical protein